MSHLLDLAREGDEDGVRALLGRDPGLARARGWALDTTALHVASDHGFLGIVRILIASEADLDAREGVSATVPLHWAARTGHPAVVQALLSAGAAVDPRDGWYGLSPLGWATVVTKCPSATDEGRTACAQALLARGAAIDGFTAVALSRPEALTEEHALARMEFAGEGDTPLHLAVRRGRADCVGRLLALGADPSGGNFLGASAAALAVGTPLEDHFPEGDAAARLFRGDEQAARLCDPRLVHEAIGLGRADVLAALLRAGADPDLRVPALVGDDREQITPLLRAAGLGSAALARVLLAAGADPDLRLTGSGATSLHRAASCGHIEVVEALLAGGANPALCEGEHGVDAAAWADYFGHSEIATRLRQAVIASTLG